MKRSQPLRRTALARGTSQLKRTRMKAAPPPDDAEWQAARAAALTRDGHACRFRSMIPRDYAAPTPTRCDGRLHVHHRIRREVGGHALDNLLTLCELHHSWAHAHAEAARELRIIIPTWEA